MKHGIHFIAGLPRSGSTLLSALLRQNPRIHATMSSPVQGLLASLLRGMSQENEGAVFIDDFQRARIMKACVEAFYEDIAKDKMVIDTNRAWTSRLPLLAKLYPKAKVICCVRNPAWVLDSVENLTRRNALEPSGIFQYNPGGTVYSRAEALMGGAGMIGFALNALREGVFDARHDRLLLVRYDSLTKAPQQVLDVIYDFLGEARFTHDPNNVEQDFEALEFDLRLGAPGLHSVGTQVKHVVRPSCLPPDLFSRYMNDDFWEKPENLPKGVHII
jgi:sulfotransferase